MKKVNKERIIIGNILKNVYTSKRKCLLCDEVSINSHLLQKNGILNNISTDGHIIQIKPRDFVVEHKDGIIDITRIGINRGMSYLLFCNSHDTKVFEDIEQKTLDLKKYRNQLLFSYRSLCAEFRKKEMNVDIFSRILKSHSFVMNDYLIEFSKMNMNANEMGKHDLQFYKNEFETEIFENENERFAFELFEFNFLPISASAVYTPIKPEIHNLEYLQNPENSLPIVFINLIPINDKLNLLIGYHKNKPDEWISNYINSWKDITHDELTKKLSDLVSAKIETWAISPEYFQKINPKEIEKLKKYWNKHAMDLRITQEIDFNLFN